MENRSLVTDEPVKFERYPVEVQDFSKTTHHFRGIYGTYLELLREYRKMPTCNRLDLQTLGCQPVKFERYPVEVQDFSKTTHHFRGIYTTYLELLREYRKMPTCNWLDLQTLGCQAVMPKNLPGHLLRGR